MKNNKGQFRLIIGLFIAALAIVAFFSLMPVFTASTDIGMSGLNCVGSPDYNATLGQKSDIGCLGIKLYIPFIVLIVLIAVVSYILYGDNRPQQPMAYG